MRKISDKNKNIYKNCLYEVQNLRYNKDNSRFSLFVIMEPL